MRRVLLRLAGPVVVLAVAAVLFGLQIVRFSGHVAMPATDATPPDVVSHYVAALDAHDCATAEALWIGGSDSPAQKWCEDVSHIEQVNVSSTLHPPHHAHGREAVITGLDVHWRPFHDDHSLPRSPFGWDYVLEHTRAGWRIVDEGQG